MLAAGLAALLLVLTVGCMPPFAFFCGEPHFVPLVARLLKLFLGLRNMNTIKISQQKVATSLMHVHEVQYIAYLARSVSTALEEVAGGGEPGVAGELVAGGGELAAAGELVEVGGELGAYVPSSRASVWAVA